MSKRILSLLCAMAIVLGMVTVPAFAAETPAATNGAQEFDTLQEAVDAFDSGVITLNQDASAITVTKDVYLDLNGYDIAGVTVTGGTLFVSDAKTDDYTVADGDYGKVTGITGAVKANEGYLQITEGEEVSFHRVNLQLNAVVLRPEKTGIYYTSGFAADEMAAEAIETFGVSLSVAAVPNESNMKSSCISSEFFDFAAGANGNAANGTLLSGILKEDITDAQNNSRAKLSVHGRAYAKTESGILFGAPATYDLKTVVELIDAMWTKLSAAQQSGLVGMYRIYTSAMDSWNIPNLKAAGGDPDWMPEEDAFIVLPIPVAAENGTVSETVTVTEGAVSVTVPAGTALAEGASQLILKVTLKNTTDSGLTVGKGEVLLPLDVHVEGIAPENTQPLTISLGKQLPENLNLGNYEAYHVENGNANEMALIPVDAEFTAHNQFKYTLDGEVILHMASFSEITLTADTANVWNGNVNYKWYTDNTAADTFEIRNADQLAGFGKIVGFMAGDIAGYDFEGKTVKLLADIDLGDWENANGKVIFHPIGYYYTEDKNGDGTTGDYYCTVSNFSGVFDGNGHTVKNFYQNTWEIKGDYDGNYYDTAMGLFGYVVNGTIKNLTVDHFSSDGEFTPTGCVAAYAENSTFENIAITNCNPRVYNTGNGGIVGIGGRSTDTTGAKLTFKNITVDNSNKITALWGSWDVACGGLMGMFRGNADGENNGTVEFINCHVAAQIDVYNDVCANYQYYAYRYSGMMIGSIRHNTTDGDGRSIPNMKGVSAIGCTVHFGDWNDYYYCELVDNTLASYTHDHQMSRLVQVKSVDVESKKVVTLQDKTIDVPTSGRVNYVVVLNKNDKGEWVHGDGDDYAECYHFLNGNVWTHDMGGIDEGIDENGDGEDDLKEDKQHIYREFNNLFTGYGWGVSSKGITDYKEEEIKILDREVANSVVKFDSIVEKGTQFITGKTVTIGELFKAKDNLDAKVAIQKGKVQVTVSPADPENLNNNVSGVYAIDPDNWENGTLTFSGIGKAIITITDYYFCTPTTLEVEVIEEPAVVKFDKLFTKDFLYRLGNHPETPVKLSSLFKLADKAEITGTVSVTIDNLSSNKDLSGVYTPNATWTNGTLNFSGYTGVVKITITDNDKCIPTELIVEIVEAKNATGSASATANNVVLLNDCGLGGVTIRNGYTFYGNGFTMSRTEDEVALSRDYAWVTMEGGTLDNVQIVAPVMNYSVLYDGNKKDSDNQSKTDGGTTRYYNIKSAISAKGNNSIVNSFVSGGRAGIYVFGGTALIENTRVVGGAAANIHVKDSESVTLRDVTLIQEPMKTTKSGYDNSVMGFSVASECNTATEQGSPIYLEGTIRQYAWAHKDYDVYVPEAGRSMISSVLSNEKFLHTITYPDGTVADSVNLGLVCISESMSVDESNIKDNRTDAEKARIKYAFEYMTGADIYSVTSFGTEEAEKWVCEMPEVYNANNTVLYVPQFQRDPELGGQKLEGTDEFCYFEDETVKIMFPSGDTKELDATKLVSINKYSGQDLNVQISCKDAEGNNVAVPDGKLQLVNAGEYTLTYTATDTLFFDIKGKQIENTEIYTWNVSVSVSLKDLSVPDAEIEVDKSVCSYYGGYPSFSSARQFYPFLRGIKIYDYIGQNQYLRFDGSDTTNGFNRIAKAVKTKNVSGSVAGNHIVEVTLVDGGVITVDLNPRATNGGGTHTATLYMADVGYGNELFVLNDSTTSAKGGAWIVHSIKFTGNNGVEKTVGPYTSGTDGNATSKSTPSKSFSTTVNYTVTYNFNGGDCGQAIGYATSLSKTVTLPTPSKSGAVFTGWFTAASGGTRVGGAGDSYTPSSNITLYAQWGKPCTVTYNANGGTCGKTTDRYTSNALELPTPVRDGYWCTGWYTAPTGGVFVGKTGASYKPADDITLYAQWDVAYTVTFNANGGSCGTNALTYKGDALTLPIAAWDGYAFDGWNTKQDGTGTKIESPYKPTSNITVYAQWKAPVTVTYNDRADGGSCSVESATYIGVALTLPGVETETGYKFLGWYTEASGGTKIGDAGATYTPTANITLYAQWAGYTVTYNANGGNCSTASQTYAGTALTLPTPTRSNYTFDGWYTASSGGTKVGNAGASYTPTADTTLYAQWTRECVTADTLVDLADGTQKRIDEVTNEDQLVVWNFFTGDYDVVPAAIIFYHGEDNYRVLKLKFSDGTEVKVIHNHGFFDEEENAFIYLEESNVENYLGHRFAKMADEGVDFVELVGYEVYEEYVGCYSIQSAIHINFMVEGMFSNTIPPIVGWFDYFKIGEGMKYDEEKMQADIEKYGLYTYEDFSDYVTYEQFIAFNGPYLKVLVGRGVLTYEDILALIATYVN